MFADEDQGVAMITTGLDLAAQPKNTAVCLVEWTGGRAKVVEVRSHQTVDALEGLIDAVNIFTLATTLGPSARRGTTVVISAHYRPGSPAVFKRQRKKQNNERCRQRC